LIIPFKVFKGVSYLDADRKEKVNIYLPVSSKPIPGVLFIFGGG